jgi:hypothetical protein
LDTKSGQPLQIFLGFKGMQAKELFRPCRPTLGRISFVAIASAPMGKDLDLEKLVLRLFCTGTLQGAARDALVPPLRGYAWRSSLHQAIFDAVLATPSSDPELLRQLLPAKLTRMGFPDVEWDELFSPPALARDEAVARVRQMLAGT